jgi:hypothetical protein
MLAQQFVKAPHLSRKERGQSMHILMYSLLPQAFTSVAPAKVFSLFPEYTSACSRIPSARHVSPPSIPGNNLVASAASHSDWSFSAEASAGVDGLLPECVADMPSALR